MSAEYYQTQEKVISRQPVFYVSGLAMDAKAVDGMLQVSLRDGRIISVPLEWFSFPVEVTAEQFADVKIQAGGAELYWPAIDMTLPIVGLLAGSDPCSYCWYRLSHFR